MPSPIAVFAAAVVVLFGASSAFARRAVLDAGVSRQRGEVVVEPPDIPRRADEQPLPAARSSLEPTGNLRIDTADHPADQSKASWREWRGGDSLPFPDGSPSSTCGALPTEPPFAGQAVYMAEQFSNATVGTSVCRTNGQFWPWMWDARRRRGLKLLAPDFFKFRCLPNYVSLLDCLSCCSGGCQLQWDAVYGKDCVVKGTPRTLTPSSDGASADKEYDPGPEDAWEFGPLDGGGICTSLRGAACGIDGLPNIANESIDDSRPPFTMASLGGGDTCTGFSTPTSCLDCCESCRPENNAAITFEGRRCVAEGAYLPRPIAGRPLTDAATGKHVLPDLISNSPAKSSWVTNETTQPRIHPDRLAKEAAAAWEQAARAEHASVASFGRHLLQLMAVGGAPPFILEDIASAAADEVRHAASSLKVAFLLRGEGANRLSPGPLRLPSDDGLGAISLVDLASGVLREGCVEETVSASLAIAAEMSSASDLGSAGTALTAARHTIRTIALEESSHALLAWATLEWALSLDSRITALIDGELMQLKQSTSQAMHQVKVVPSYGMLLSSGDRDNVRNAVLSRLVIPQLEALIANKQCSICVTSSSESSKGGSVHRAVIAALGFEGPTHVHSVDSPASIIASNSRMLTIGRGAKAGFEENEL